ncbi:hypothetical protein Tco_0304816 [Tanacetum coccineum]
MRHRQPTNLLWASSYSATLTLSPKFLAPSLGPPDAVTRNCDAVSMHCRFNLRRISLTGFPAQSVRSSNTIALDSLYLLVLITGTSPSRQHESRKLPTAELFDVNSGRITIHHFEY